MRYFVSNPEPGHASRRARELRRSMTPAEKVLWERVRRGGICGLRFRRQQAIGPFIADFYCHSLRLVVEIDGSVHEGQAGYDAARDASFQNWGIATVRFSNDEVLEHTDEVVSALHRLAGSATPPPPPRRP